MPNFVALTSRGLRDSLLKECNDLGFKNPKLAPGGVAFEGSWAAGYQAVYRLRLATRVLYPVLDFPCFGPDDLYHNIKRHDFTRYIDVNQTLRVEATVRDNHQLRDSRFVALKAKDAIVDQFREKVGARPNVDKDNPDLSVVIRLIGTKASVAIDLAGMSLSQRGYREQAGTAPLREHLAAGLLSISGWRPGVPLVDPMCGSGTIVLEAALISAGVAPGRLRPPPALMRWKTFQREAWDKVVQQAELAESVDTGLRLWGFDENTGAIARARQNARRAGVADHVRFDVCPFQRLVPPCTEPGVLVVNPPYGRRLGSVDTLDHLYRSLGEKLKEQFPGWTLWLLSGEESLTPHLQMRADRQARLFNGDIECRFLQYRIRDR